MSRPPALFILLALASAPAAQAASAVVTPAAAHLGAFGLELTVGTQCVAADQLDLGPGSSPLAGDYQACVALSAGDVEVPNGAGVVFTAGERVALGDGLRVIAGGELTLRLDSSLSSEFTSAMTSAPREESSFRAGFYLRLDELALVEGDEIEHLTGYSTQGTALFRVLLRRPGGSPDPVAALAARLDDGSWLETAAGEEIPLTGGWIHLRLDWIAGSGGGHLLLSVDDAPWVGLSGLENDGARLDSLRWGAIAGRLTGTTGKLLMDGFSSWR